MINTQNNRIALITGASGGIGQAVAIELAKHDMHVIAAARNTRTLENLCQAIAAEGAVAEAYAVDLTDPEAADDIAAHIRETYGRLDVLVGNAAMLGPLAPVQDIPQSDWQAVMDLNLHANIRLIEALHDLLMESSAPRIVFTTSGMADLAYPHYGPYAASKAALNVFMRTYAAEVEGSAMRVNAFSPGMVDTAMLRKAFPQGYPEDATVRMPGDVASACAALCTPCCTRHGEIVKAG